MKKYFVSEVEGFALDWPRFSKDIIEMFQRNGFREVYKEDYMIRKREWRQKSRRERRRENEKQETLCLLKETGRCL